MQQMFGKVLVHQYTCNNKNMNNIKYKYIQEELHIHVNYMRCISKAFKDFNNR